MTFERVLVFPHKGCQNWLKHNDASHIEGSLAKMYVGITRARHSVAFVYDGAFAVPGIAPYLGP